MSLNLHVPRTALICLSLIVPLAGCGDGPREPATALTMLAVNPYVGRSAFQLECAPAGGDLPNPSRACAALARAPQLITRPRPFVCAGGTFSWWDVTITGRLNGKRITRAFSTCWTTQMATLGRFGLGWAVLQKHLLPRRHESVIAGTTHVFAAGVLRPADLVTCDIRGHQLALGVPNNTGGGASVGYSGTNIVSVTLTVTDRRDGSVSAACRAGSERASARILEPQGVGAVRFGMVKREAVAALSHLFGAPTARGINTACGSRYTEVEWGDLVAEFRRDRFSGFRFSEAGYPLTTPGSPREASPSKVLLPKLAVSTGVSLGGSLAELRAAYPGRLQRVGAVMWRSADGLIFVADAKHDPVSSTTRIVEIKIGTCGGF
jgi:hypothetical protein